MKLQGRHLAIQMHGEDVKQLQTELRQLGYSISQDESARSFFASTTQQAISAFQRNNRLPVIVIVNEATAELINTRVDALQPRRFTVHGTVTQSDGAPLVGATVRAVDWDRTGEDSLGEATTQSDGRYEISYTADQGFYMVSYEPGGKSPSLEDQIGGMEKLAGTREKAGCCDISQVHQATGWGTRIKVWETKRTIY